MQLKIGTHRLEIGDAWLGLLLVVVTFVAYQPVWHAGFIWDDDAHLTRNPCIVGPLGFKGIWTSSAAMYYPLVLTSFWVMHALWGLNPLPYHLVNVGVHVACAILLWGVLRRLKARGAWLGAALWALHPVQVESVAWITELKNTQSCFFYLLAILFFLQWREAGRKSLTPVVSQEGRGQQGRDITGPSSIEAQPRERAYILALLCAVFAILSKSSTVMLPVVLALCWWWMERQWRWGDLLRLAPFLLVSAVASGWTIWEQKYHSGALGPEWAQSSAQRLTVAGKAVWFYLGKLLWPHPLIFIYPRWPIDATRLGSYLPAFAVVLVGVALWLAVWRRWPEEQGLQATGQSEIRRSAPAALSAACGPWLRSHALGSAFFFAFACFLVPLFPVLDFFNVFFFRYLFVGDHFQYLASIGPLALLGAGMGSLLSAAPRAPGSALNAPPSWARIPDFCVFLLLAVLAILTWRQAWMYTDNETLWQTTLARNPAASMAQVNLGLLQLEQGHLDEAIKRFRAALEIQPADPEAHDNLGNALFQHGETNEAVAHFQKALELDPKFAPAHLNWGLVLFQQGKLDEAAAHFAKAVELQPGYVQARNNLGWLLLREGRVDEAIVQFRAAIEYNPRFAEARFNLGNALLQKDRLDEAILSFENAVQINPDYAEAYYNLGVALFRQGRTAETIAYFRRALELRPDFAEARRNLDALLKGN